MKTSVFIIAHPRYAEWPQAYQTLRERVNRTPNGAVLSVARMSDALTLEGMSHPRHHEAAGIRAHPTSRPRARAWEIFSDPVSSGSPSPAPGYRRATPIRGL